MNIMAVLLLTIGDGPQIAGRVLERARSHKCLDYPLLTFLLAGLRES